MSKSANPGGLLERIGSVKTGLIWTMLLLMGLSTVSVAEPQLNDQTIASTVYDEILTDPGTSGIDIDVISQNGIVTLTGTAQHLLEYDRAVGIAESIKGVRAVVNRLEVKPSSRSDEKLATLVKDALFVNPRTEAYEIRVSVEQAQVTLTGQVDSWQERMLADKVVRSVIGVKDVNNQLTVAPTPNRPDDEIKMGIVSALRWDRLVDDELIEVAVEQGNVTLSGTVGSAAELRRARSHAFAAGVKAVDTSEVEVTYWARDENLRKSKYVAKDDKIIRKAVEAALFLDPRTASFNVDVSVDDGIVTLRGVVDTLAAKRAAAQDALNTVSVWRVKNHLRVRGEKIEDAQLAKYVNEALARDPFVESYEIAVKVNNGLVNLSGVVDTLFEKRHTENVVSQVRGVVSVGNQLTVHRNDRFTFTPYVSIFSVYPVFDTNKHPLIKEDWAIWQDIRDELWWSPFVDSEQITVTVDDGIATLTGQVDTWRERVAAAENAYEGGALSVVNKLEVNYGPNFEIF